MPYTCPCKACGHDVPAGDACPACGGKLNPAAARILWEERRLPVASWICWNSILRVALPVFGLTVAVILAVELAFGGLRSAEALLTGGFGTAALAILAALLLGTGLVLLARGPETLTCWVDKRGLHMTDQIAEPTRLRLLARGFPAETAAKARAGKPLKATETSVSWREIRRIQLWPQKGLILAYAPRFWLRLAVPCPAHLRAEVLEAIREYVGKRKDILLPEALRPETEKKPKRRFHLFHRKHAAPAKGAKHATAKKKTASAKGKSSRKKSASATSRPSAHVSMEEIIAMNEEEAQRQALDSERESRRRR